MNSELHNNAIYQNNGHEGKQQEVQVAPSMPQTQFSHNMIAQPQYSTQSMGFQHLQSSLQQGTTVTNFPLHQNIAPQTQPVNYQLRQANHGMVSHMQQANHGVVSSQMMMRNNNMMRTNSNHSPTENMVAYGQMMQTQQHQPLATTNTQYTNESKKGLQKAMAMQTSGSAVANSRSQNQSRLAEVPTQRLAQKSMISLPVSTLDEPKSISKNNSTEGNGNAVSSERQSGHIIKTNMNNDENNEPTANQFQCRKRASYSAACDATLKAQEEAMKLYGNTGRSACNTPAKRASPEPANGGNDTGHKYVKVVGGKPSPSPQESNVSLSHFFVLSK